VSSGDGWLVVGHGSVGSFIASRLLRGGAQVRVLDPNPRVPLTHGVFARFDGRDGPVDYVVSCVPPEVAESVPATITDLTTTDGIFFDWNTVSPEAKQRTRDALMIEMVDVALLDSLDADVQHPFLAISGSNADRGRRVLQQFGFAVTVAGDVIGQAAQLKYLRSIFTKGLEALVLEYSALAADVQGNQVVRASLQNNMGSEFMRFFDLLLTTNRIHADRRSRELADAVSIFRMDGAGAELSSAAVGILTRAAAAWQTDDAPRGDAPPDQLAAHLRMTLCR
jgi:3-hydroxyisobutyrate dehydrogenase-like beta-hydroxyacid dehydrogenase